MVHWLQAKVAKSSSWRVWLGSWRSSSTGAGGNGKPGSGSLNAAVAAAAAATHPRSPAAQQVSKHPVMPCGPSQLLDHYIRRTYSLSPAWKLGWMPMCL